MEAHIGYGQYFGIHAASAFHHDLRRVWKLAEVDAVEPFVVDDLLDFSNEEIGGQMEEDKDQLSNESANSSITVAEKIGSSSTPDKPRVHSPNSLKEEELCVACDEIAELEWLSTFVEDSFSTDEALKPAYNSALLALSSDNRSELSINSKDQLQAQSSLCGSENSATSERLEATVSGRARSKRSRTGVRVWSSSLDLSSRSKSSSDYMYELTNSESFPSFISLHCPSLSSETEFLTPKGLGDHCLHHTKKNSKAGRKKAGSDASQPRRCTHCLTQRTPQWRAGPAGPKTLCNACGVRFKSGRLLPEYRPAMSPTFISHQHSNSHRKVLEMRKQNEVLQQHQREQHPQAVVRVQEAQNSS